MMISIGHNNFLESSYIDEVLTAHGARAARLKRLAAEVGMLITATDGKRAKSIIRLKTKHLVLSSLEPETIQSEIDRLNTCPACANHCTAAHPMEKNMQRNDSEVGAVSDGTWELVHRSLPWTYHDEPEKRSGIERRRFSYSYHIPERRNGADRRKSQ